MTPKPPSKSAKGKEKAKKSAKKDTTTVKGIKIQRKAAKGKESVTASGGKKSAQQQTSSTENQPSNSQQVNKSWILERRNTPLWNLAFLAIACSG